MSVQDIAAAAKEAGIEGEAALIAFTLGFGAGVSKPVLRESVGEMLTLEEAQPSTLYVHPVSGNCLGLMCYIADRGLGIQLSFMDIMAGKQMAEWYLKLTGTKHYHAVPTLCDHDGKGVFESGVILRKLAGYAGDEISDIQAMALDYRQASMYKYCSMIYGPYLGFGAGDIAEGIKGFKDKIEPMLEFFLAGGKFMGGADKPGPADYSIVPVLTMLPPYTQKEASDKIKQYVADFIAASPSWEKMSAQQTGYVAGVVEKKGLDAPWGA